MPRLAIFAIVCSLAGVSAQTPVTPGRPIRFTLPAVETSTLFHGDYSHRLSVPASATRAVIAISGNRTDVDVDLHVRFGADVALQGSIVADYSSEGMDASERIVIDAASPKPLKTGDYFIAYAVYTKNTEVEVTLTVTLEGVDAERTQLVRSEVPDTCRSTGARDFTLASPARLKEIYALYQWSAGESRVDYSLEQGPLTILKGSLTRSSTCLAEGSPWCLAEGTPDLAVASGTYRLQLEKPGGCSATDGGPAVIAIYGQLLPPPTWSVLSESMIGPGGGTVQAEVTIQVPAGAVTTPSRVKVSALETAEPPSPQRISKIFQVDGLGVNQTKPIEVSVPLTGVPNGPVTVVWSVEMPPGLTLKRGVKLLPARVENGRAIVTLGGVDPGTEGAGDTPSGARVDGKRRQALVDPNSVSSRLLAMGGFAEVNSPTGRFVVHFPVSGDNVMELAEDTGIFLDRVEARLIAMGVNTARRTAPIHVYLASPNGTEGSLFGLTSNQVNGVTESDIWGGQNVGFVLNLNFGRERENFHVTAAHELLHVYQAAFDPRNISLRRAVTDSPWLWLLEATPTWLERAFADRPEQFTPTEARVQCFFAFKHGLQYATAFDQNDNAHGYGAASLVEYLGPVLSSRNVFLGNLMNLFAESTGIFSTGNRYSAVEAVRMVAGEPWITLWPGYFNEWLEGRIYPAISVYPGPRVTSSILNITTDPEVTNLAFSLGPDLSKAKTFTLNWQAPPLSAALVHATLPPKTSVPAGSKLTNRFKVQSNGDYFFLYHWDRQAQRTTRLYTGFEPFTITDLNAVAGGVSTELYAFVLNSEDRPDEGQTFNQRDFEVVFEPGAANPLANAKGVSVTLRAVGTFEDPVTKSTQTNGFIGWGEFFTGAHCGSAAVRTVTWSGTTMNVTAECNGRMGGEDNPIGVATTTATVRMNPSFTAVTNLQINQTLTVRTTSHQNEYRKTASLCLQNLPADDTVKYRMYLARVPGPGAASHVCGVDIKREGLNGDKVTSTLVLKSLDWPAEGLLDVQIQ